jgi:hypothetical protein
MATPAKLNHHYCRPRHEIYNLGHAAHGYVFDTITNSTYNATRFALPAEPVLAGLRS